MHEALGLTLACVALHMAGRVEAPATPREVRERPEVDLRRWGA